jgi:hypothetical protein
LALTSQTSGGRSVGYWNFFRVAAKLAASRERLSSMELVMVSMCSKYSPFFLWSLFMAGIAGECYTYFNDIFTQIKIIANYMIKFQIKGVAYSFGIIAAHNSWFRSRFNLFSYFNFALHGFYICFNV